MNAPLTLSDGERDTPAAPFPAPAPGVVLVVDDAPDTVRMLCAALAEEGYTVLVATGGEEALSRFELAVPDAVLMDAVMPGLDGFAACRRLKAEPAWAHVPVIFMTGLTETEDIVQGFAAGGTDYVVKPLRVAEVLARLATHVRQAQAVRLAREAVDVGGLGTVLLDGRGRVAWQSPRAAAWLREGRAGEQPASWLAQAAARCEALASQGQAAEVRRPGGAPGEPALVVRHLGAAGLNERMLVLRLDATEAPAGDARRLDSAALTPRETEVLSWVAKGKTNRDIGEILGMSPRTVNKHLEHVFEKLGVETRAAAAALASRGMGGAWGPRAPHYHHAMLSIHKLIPRGRGLAQVLLRRAPTVALDWDVRQKSRFDATDSDGRHLGVVLPRGTVVRDGDVLVAEDGSLVRVQAAPQPVMVVRTCPTHGSPFDLARAAYHLGNRHVPLALASDHLMFEPDPVLAQMLDRMHLIVTETQAGFDPEGGAYGAEAARGHAHGHGHGHAHGHDHGHEHGHAHDHDHGHAHDHDHDHGHEHGHAHDHGHAHAHAGGSCCGHDHAPASAPATAPVRGKPLGIAVTAAPAPHVHGPGCGHDHDHGHGHGHGHGHHHGHGHDH